MHCSLIVLEDTTFSQAKFISASAPLQISSSAPTFNSSSVGCSEGSTPLTSSCVAVTTGSDMDIQHTVSLTDVTGVATSCTTTHVSPTVSNTTHAVTNANLSSVPLGMYVHMDIIAIMILFQRT